MPVVQQQYKWVSVYKVTVLVALQFICIAKVVTTLAITKQKGKFPTHA